MYVYLFTCIHTLSCHNVMHSLIIVLSHDMHALHQLICFVIMRYEFRYDNA